MQALKTGDLIGIAEPGRIQRGLKYSEGLIVRLERNGKRMSVIPAEGERKPRGIRESHRSAMNHFCDEGQSLQGPRAKFLQQQQLGKIVELAFVSDAENGPKALQVNIGSSNFMARR